MKTTWQRFINQRTILLLFIMLFIAFFLQLREGRFSGEDNYVSYEQYRLNGNKACVISEKGCSRSLDDVRLTLSFMQRPSALIAFPVQIRLDGLPDSEEAHVNLVFTMKGMDMGEQKQKLLLDKPSGNWLGKVILPICTSGRSDWHAKVEVISQQKIYLAEYDFELFK